MRRQDGCLAHVYKMKIAISGEDVEFGKSLHAEQAGFPPVHAPADVAIIPVKPATSAKASRRWAVASLFKCGDRRSAPRTIHRQSRNHQAVQEETLCQQESLISRQELIPMITFQYTRSALV